MTDPPRPAPPAGSHRREGPGLEFDRVSFFTDAVFAIAMTLLVVELEPPRLYEAPDMSRALLRAVLDSWPEIFGFFLGFVLLGRYWMAHHDFFASLRSIDRRLISLNLVYLAFVGFMPYPVALISAYEESPVAFGLFAVTMATISAMEVVMFLYAVRHGHTRRAMSPEATRFGLVAAGAPVVVIVASLPLAAISTTLALLSWLVLFPISARIHRRVPAEFRASPGEEGELTSGADLLAFGATLRRRTAMMATPAKTDETTTEIQTRGGDALAEELTALKAEVRALGDRLKSTEVAARERAKAYASDVGAELRRYEEEIAAEARANPWRSLGFAALAGFLLGLFMRR